MYATVIRVSSQILPPKKIPQAQVLYGIWPRNPDKSVYCHSSTTGHWVGCKRNRDS